jgi:mitochondrial Rho GTPase 1
VTLEKIPGVIIDYSSREQTDNDLIKEIENASVICLVYGLDDDESKNHIKSYWLPKIEEVEESMSKSSGEPSKHPIIIVANKCDTINESGQILNDPFIKSIVISNNQIETCVQCSAKTLKNLPEVFFYAQKSVIYPTAPIYNVDNKQLTNECVKCLTRIFTLCDHDNDGRLNNQELTDFQLKCFSVRLNTSSLQEVKSMLSESPENLFDNQITLKGFIYMHLLFVKKGRHETTWTVLKKYGYNRDLTMNRDYLTAK